MIYSIAFLMITINKKAQPKRLSLFAVVNSCFITQILVL